MRYARNIRYHASALELVAGVGAVVMEKPNSGRGDIWECGEVQGRQRQNLGARFAAILHAMGDLL